MAKHKGGKSSTSLTRPKPRPKPVNQLSFAQVVDAADQLSVDEQEELVEIVRRRLAQTGHERIVAETKESYEEFKRGLCRVMTPAQIMREIRK